MSSLKGTFRSGSGRWNSLTLMTTTVVVMTMTMMTSLDAASSNYPPRRFRGCDEPPAPKRGIYRMSVDKLSVEFFCQPGHYLIGSNEASCQNGRWSSQPPVCVGGDCEMPIMRDGSMVWLHGGGMVRIECRSGFELRGGSKVMACIDGRWNSTTPQCISSSAGTTEQTKLAKSAALVGKHPKSEDKEEEPSKKNEDDWMRDADYSCVSNDFVVYPPPVPNARTFTHWTLFEGRPRLFTTYQCKWGFKPTIGGARNVYCRNREWVGTRIKCQAVAHEEPNHQSDFPPGIVRSLSHDELLMRADYSCVGSGTNAGLDPPVSENSTPVVKFVILEGRPHLYAEYVCDEGYELANRNRGHLYCKGKTWIGEMPKCTRVTSSRTCAMRNGGCDQLCSYDNRGQAFCSCREGFLLQPDKIACHDVDECEVNGANCDHLCSNSIGSFQCSCYDGYKLEIDRKKCTKMQDNGKEAD